MDGTLTPLQRFFLAFVAFFAVLFNRRFAEEVYGVRERLKHGQPLTPTLSPGRGEGEKAIRAPDRGEAERAAQKVAPPAITQPIAPVRRDPEVAPRPVAPPAPPLPRPPDHAGNLQVIALLQRDGRLLDFLEESLEGFTDAEIGAAARTVHEGCKKALDLYLTLEPVYREAEGASITVLAGFDPAAVRLTGNVVGAPPFKGSLRHHGWRAARAAFPPPPAHDPTILAPAEVEL